MIKKATFFTLLGFLISFGSFAQKKRIIYHPRLLQTSVRAGFVNGSLNLEYRLNPKTMASVDFGIGLVYLQSNYYNKYNENYKEYNKDFGNFLNWGREWWSTYTSIQVRRIISGRSKTKYESFPYANTFTYYGLQLKYNGHELKNWIDNGSDIPFRETYRFAALFGRQVELGKQSNFLFDIYVGLGGISNYKLTAVESKFLIGTRIGVGLWKLNK